MPGASEATSAWFTAARTRMIVGSTTSRIGMPGRTSSPSCISAIVPLLKTERRTTRPSSGERIRMRVALVAAWSQAFLARSR
jgi:hypothetical protein